MGKTFYRAGHKSLQARMDTERLAERLEQVTVHHALTDADRTFIGAARLFFLGTASPHTDSDKTLHKLYAGSFRSHRNP
jgi:hypothetical protein